MLVPRGYLLDLLPPSWHDLLPWHHQLIKTPDPQSRKGSQGIAESALQGVQRFYVEGLEMALRNAQQILGWILHYTLPEDAWSMSWTYQVCVSRGCFFLFGPLSSSSPAVTSLMPLVVHNRLWHL